ncbi:MAG: hypothetical protein K2P81_09360, partial [Bacteriovoracaceae bacterium]|nr:hypothetical protein [Bacteriovoracaceae bacterium]
MKILIWGCGNMASAFALGLHQAHPELEFYCWNPTTSKAQALAFKLKGKVYQDEKISFSAVILGFKPQQLEVAKIKLL